MDIQDLRIFARVAALQNLSAVGTELSLTPGTISKRIQALEEELCVRLFDRTTRSIRITEEGATFLAHAQRILSELDQARANVGDNVSKPKGKLKVTAPASLAERFVAPAICAFMRAYPDISSAGRPHGSRRQPAGGRLRRRHPRGVLSDSSLIAKRLTADREIIVAAPAFLHEHGTPKTLNDLSQLPCLILGESWSWAFGPPDKNVLIRVNGRLRSDNGELLKHAALAGLGLLRTSELRVRPELDKGRLVRVLAEHEISGDAGIWAVYPGPRHILPKLRVFLDYLAFWFRSLQIDDEAPLPAPAPGKSSARVSVQ